MRVIGTLSGFYPNKSDEWQHYMDRYLFLTLRRKQPSQDFLESSPS